MEPPQWVDKMCAGLWYRIYGNDPDLGLASTPLGTRYLEDNDPARDPTLNPPYSGKERLRRMLGRMPLAPWHGSVRFSAITEAWNGAVFASRFGPAGSMIVFGGGHDDYFGSDVHAFDLASRQWSRITDGYIHGDRDSYGTGAVYPNATYPDGSPLPPHTYDYVQYDTLVNDVLLAKGQTELGKQVKAIAIPHLLNLDTLSWRQDHKHEDATLNSGGWSTWDANRRVLWIHAGDAGGGNAFLAYSPDGENEDGTFGRWGERYDNKFQNQANHNCMQIDPAGKVVLVVNHQRDALFAINPDIPALSPEPLRDSGERPELSPYASLEYSTGLNCFVYYSVNDGPNVYGITAPSPENGSDPLSSVWTWSRLDARDHSLDPVADAATQSRYPVNRSHTFGRFRVADYDDVALAILVRHIDSPVYVAKLRGATSKA
jgi:hypothetical protein